MDDGVLSEKGAQEQEFCSVLCLLSSALPQGEEACRILSAEGLCVLHPFYGLQGTRQALSL